MRQINIWLARLPKWLICLVCALLVWVGLTFFTVGVTGLVLGVWAAITGHPLPSKPHMPLKDYLLLWSQLFFWGTFLLCLAFRLGRVCGYAGLGVYSNGRTIDDWSDRWRGMWAPGPDDFLNSWTVDFEEPIEEVKSRLQTLPPLNWNPIRFLKKDDRPACKLWGDKVVLIAAGMRSNNSIWEGRLRTNVMGGTIMEGVVNSSKIQGYGWKDGFFRFFWCFGMMTGGAAFLSHGKAMGFAFWMAPLFMWLLNTTIGGAGRWDGRQHERQLENLFKGTLGARAVYLKPRYEIFSLEWWKNLRQTH